MGYDMSQFIKQFSERTLDNLNIIEANACKGDESEERKGDESEERKGDESEERKSDESEERKSDESKERKSFEVTQLINSLFGLVLVPYEAYKEAVFKEVYRIKGVSSENQKKTTLLGSFDGKKILIEEQDKKFKDCNGNIIDKKETNHWCDEWLKDRYPDQFAPIEKVLKICMNEKRIYSGYSMDTDGVTVTSFMWHLRNSIAHSGTTGVTFFPVKGIGVSYKEITHVIFCCGQKNNIFCIKLGLSELKTVVTAISKLFSDYEKSDYGQETLKEAINSIDRCEELMKNGKKQVEQNGRNRRARRGQG